MSTRTSASMLRRWKLAMVAREVFRARLIAIDDRPTRGEIRRAAGDCICVHCQGPYRDHPQHPVETFATMLCDGRLVKL